MGGFFLGWRRKVGVVTLLLACVFAVGWVRSFVMKDRIDFTKLTGFGKKHNRLAGLATDRQSLVLLVYKVDEMECKFGQNVVTYTSEDRGIQTAESQPVSNVEQLNSTMVGTQSPTSDLQLNQPLVQTNFVTDQARTSPAATGVFNATAPLPAAMITNPPEMLSIQPNPSNPLTSKLIATNRVPLVIIPFWSITIPLSLASMWLLLTNARRSTQREIAQPVSAEKA